MGSTAQSTDLIVSTYVAGISQGAAINMRAVTSSGAFFQCGDASRIIIFGANASSSDSGALFVEPGGVWTAGARGQAASTGSTVYSTATAPLAVSVPLHGITGSSAVISTTGSYRAIGPLDSAPYKSSDGKIFIVASTGSTKMAAGVYRMLGGSTN